jgi:hypothetical protein
MLTTFKFTETKTCSNGATNYPHCNADSTFLNVSANQTTLQLWPDAKSFDLTNQTFQAVDFFDYNSCNSMRSDTNACDRVRNGVKNIKTNSSTVYYYHVDLRNESRDFNWLYLTAKNWSSTNLPLNIKGVTQSDGSFLASEISMGSQ